MPFHQAESAAKVEAEAGTAGFGNLGIDHIEDLQRRLGTEGVGDVLLVEISGGHPFNRSPTPFVLSNVLGPDAQRRTQHRQK